MGSQTNHPRILILSLSLAFLLTTFTLSDSSNLVISGSWTYPSGYDPHGGYIDRLVFKVYPSEDIAQALLALLTGTVYSYDELIPYHSVPDLQANPGIEITSELGMSYRQFTLNCDRFPTNLTAYRVALAQALNKYMAVEITEGGFAQVMDNPIPLAFEFWSYENQMTSHFYAEDIISANATLDAAHIIDTPDSPHPGWRYYDADMSGNWTQGDFRGDVLAPEGLKIELWASAGGISGFYPVLTLFHCMEKCGLQADIVEVSFNWLISGLESGEYNLGCFSWNINPPGNPPYILYDMFHSEGEYYDFFYRFNNSEYDYNCTQFMNAPTRLEARNWAWNCCRILMAEMPMIVCFNFEFIHAYRTDLWEGYIPQVGVNRMKGNPYTYEQIRLKEEAGGPFGCLPTEYVTILSEGMESTNTILTSGYAQTIFNLLYSQLWRIDPLDPYTEAAPDLAYDWTLEPTIASGDIQEGMKYTFHLYENITWHDGTPFTSEDVQYSFLNIHPLGTYTAENVESIYRVDTPDEYTVEIYSNRSGYVTFIEATSIQILPKHIWNSYESINFTWSPTTPEDLSGTGCYQWVSRTTGQEIVLNRYADWHFAIDHPPRISCPPPAYLLWVIIFTFIGVLIIVLQLFILCLLLFRRRKRQAKKGEATQ